MENKPRTSLSYSTERPRPRFSGSLGIALFASVIFLLATACSIAFVPRVFQIVKERLPFPCLLLTGGLSGIALAIALVGWPWAYRNRQGNLRHLGKIAHLISAATLIAVVGRELLFVRAALDTGPSGLPAQHLATRLSRELGISWSPQWVYVRGVQTGWNEKSEWFLFQVPPGEIDSLKASILHNAQHSDGCWEVPSTGFDSIFPIAGDTPPPFWKPDKLPDPDRLKLRATESAGGKTSAMGYGFVFSRATGKVYAYRW